MVDNLTAEQRSYTMARIRSKNTAPELAVRGLLRKSGLNFRLHDSSLPGCPDIVFRKARVVVFIDGDYWHGWRFSLWKNKLAPYWKDKIERNRQRDARNFAKLRRWGWLVIRIWEHQIERDLGACVERIEPAVRARSKSERG
jgi:DNA mismatch endonuclease, patch repair protein